MCQQIRGKRWGLPFFNVLGQRVLPIPERTTCLAELGMPVTPALMRLSGKWGSSENLAFYNDPELQGFRD
jgi:hypothetical protein